MPNITKFDRSNLKIVRHEMETALKFLEERLGVKVVVGNARFTGSHVTFKVGIATVNSDGVAETKEMLALKAFYPDLVNKAVTVGVANGPPQCGIKGIVIGYSTRAKKYPFIVKTDSGLYKAAESQVTR